MPLEMYAQEEVRLDLAAPYFNRFAESNTQKMMNVTAQDQPTSEIS